MDSFVAVQAKAPVATRKVLKERTVMDAAGYLVTENVWVEEPIPAEELAKSAAKSPPKKQGVRSAPRPQPAAKKASKKGAPKDGKKQSGMASFFSKK